MKIVFMGTPEFAVPSLKRLYADGHEIAGVFTQPDKPRNRGMKLSACPVKECAITHGTPVFQPSSLKGEEALETLRGLAPELIVVAAYGKLLPPSVLELPRCGCVNVHSSLLPKYRGAAPIHWAVLSGEKETGVTIMYMAEALDAGDIITAVKTPIGPEETSEELHDRLMLLGAEALGGAVRAIGEGTASRTPQDEAKSCYAPMLSRELSPMDWNRPAAALHNQVRGLLPWPAASAALGGRRFKLFRAAVGGDTREPAGTVVAAGTAGIGVACGDGRILQITELQAEGGKRMGAAEYLRGHPIAPGVRAE